MKLNPVIPIIHVIDDDSTLRNSLNILLEIEGYAVYAYASARAFLETTLHCENSCILTDMHMPEMTGLDLLAALNERAQLMPVIVMTGRADAQLKKTAMERGAFDFLEKPFDVDRLFASIRAALKHRNELHSGPPTPLPQLRLVSDGPSAH